MIKLLCLIFLMCTLTAFSLDNTTNDAVSGARIKDMKLFIDGQRFHVKGVDYSPVPVGASPIFNRPYGDYFSSGYEAVWKRDFPRIRQLGMNTIRIYTWRPDQDHTAFLDFAHKNEIKVLATYYLGTASTTRLATQADRNAAIAKFTNETRRYADHPALLGWTFGNEINSLVNGFLTHLNSYANCQWEKDCWNSMDDKCSEPKRCIYREVFRLVNEAAMQAKQAIQDAGGAPKIMATAFADLDGIMGYLQEFDSQYHYIDSWGFNLYRGKNFGEGDDDVLANWATISIKPLMVTEYGVDAYRDYCGICTVDDCASPCHNGADAAVDGYGEDESAQAEWSGALTKELINHWDDGTLGGFIMSWVDEYWKNAVAVSGCQVKFGQPGFTDAACEWKAHVDCPHIDASSNSLCGYWLSTTFDNYVNEGWYGLNRVRQASVGGVDHIEPREVFYAIQKLYGGSFYIASTKPLYRQSWFIAALTLALIGTVPLLVFEVGFVMHLKNGHYEADAGEMDRDRYTEIVMEEESPLRRPRTSSDDD